MDGLDRALDDCRTTYDPGDPYAYLRQLDVAPREVYERLKEVVMGGQATKIFEKWKTTQDAYLADLETLIQVYTRGEEKQAWEMQAGLQARRLTYERANTAWVAAQARLNTADLKPFLDDLQARRSRSAHLIGQGERILEVLSFSQRA